MPTSAASLLAALDAHALDATDRGDERFGHVSDLPFCDRKTWARRNGLPLEPIDAVTRRKFMLGDAVEDHAAEAIAKAFPGARRHVRMAIRVEGRNVVSREIPEDAEPHSDEIVGHLDLDLPDVVLEVKSTVFLTDRKTWKPIVPTADSLQRHYQVQDAGYALARGKGMALVVVCRSSGLAVAALYDPETFRDEIVDRIQDVLLFTAPGAPRPPAEPFYAWECKSGYCPYVGCEKREPRRG